MAKLVRARPKLPEFLPEWIKCCPQQVEYQQAIGELVLDLGDICLAGVGVCIFCGAPSPRTKVAKIMTGEHQGRTFALSAADIDETGVPDGNYVTFAAAEQP